jgi:hydroxymethylpyrimidine pyrophosphatase-like HAD family hydrolase
MVIVFDMDNTLTDEFGTGVRPGITSLLSQLKKEGHALVLWTNSKKERAKTILYEHSLHRYFSHFIYWENYDPHNKGLHKDIRKVKGDILIDDDPSEIKFIKGIKKRGYCISPFRKGKKVREDEITEVYRFIHKKSKFFN